MHTYRREKNCLKWINKYFFRINIALMITAYQNCVGKKLKFVVFIAAFFFALFQKFETLTNFSFSWRNNEEPWHGFCLLKSSSLKLLMEDIGIGKFFSELLCAWKVYDTKKNRTCENCLHSPWKAVMGKSSAFMAVLPKKELLKLSNEWGKVFERKFRDKGVLWWGMKFT